MKRIIIFDFNRTLFDPDTARLVPGTRRVLRFFLQQEFSLFLISRKEKGRKQHVVRLDLGRFFSDILFVEKKTRKEFTDILRQSKASCQESFVIGDRIRDEITLGKSVGLQTVWIQTGRFASETPRSAKETPTFIVTHLTDVPWLFHMLLCCQQSAARTSGQQSCRTTAAARPFPNYKEQSNVRCHPKGRARIRTMVRRGQHTTTVSSFTKHLRDHRRSPP